MVVGAELDEALHLVAGEVAGAAGAEEAEQGAGAEGEGLGGARSVLRFEGFGYGRGRGRGVLGEPLAEQGQGEPVHVGVCGRDAFASRRGQCETEELGFGLHFPFLQFVHFVFNHFEHIGWHRVLQLARP